MVSAGNHPQHETDQARLTPASASTPAPVSAQTLVPGSAPSQPRAPGYGQYLTDPLNDPMAATGHLEPAPRRIPAWRGSTQANTILPQSGTQPTPNSRPASRQSQPRAIAPGASAAPRNSLSTTPVTGGHGGIRPPPPGLRNENDPGAGTQPPASNPALGLRAPTANPPPTLAE